MAEESNQNKTQGGPTKSFMTAGPTLHYSHANITGFWLGAVAVYTLACLFWSKMLTGSFLPFSIEGVIDPSQWRLERFLLYPLSIFEYPWQIIVLGSLMGLLAVMPPLLAQLLSFSYCIPLLFALAFIADMPLFAVFVMISSIAVACRPLRFRSRFIAIALCLAPQIFYWAYFGSISNVEPVKWGFSFAPWITAWLTAIIFAGAALSIGHFSRYRPGLNFMLGALVLVITILVFRQHIGFDELAYQQYVALNNPEQASDFQDQSISEAIDASIKNPSSMKYFSNFFSFTEPILLRQELKEDILTQLANDRWPGWFAVTEPLNFPAKRQTLLGQYNAFINQKRPWWLPETIFKKLKGRRSRSKRMPMALYYKAIVSEMTPNPTMIMENEMLHFSSEYPHRVYLPIWYDICENYPTSMESIEARRRIAMHLSGSGLFDNAEKLLEQADAMITEKLKHPAPSESGKSSFFTPFTKPKYTAISDIKLLGIRQDIEKLENLITAHAKVKDAASRLRLARFILLDRNSIDYAQNIELLISQTPADDPLYDNLMLAKVLLTKDRTIQTHDLEKLHQIYNNTDGGTEAFYELAIMKVRDWQELNSNVDIIRRQQTLSEAKKIIANFIQSYPKSSYCSQLKSILEGLPANP